MRLLLAGSALVLLLAGCTAAPPPPPPEAPVAVSWTSELDGLDTMLRNVCDTPELVEQRGWRYCEAAASDFLDAAMTLMYDVERETPAAGAGLPATGIEGNMVACMGDPATEAEAAQCLGQGPSIVTAGRSLLHYMAGV